MKFIELTRINGNKVYVNTDQILSVDTSDSVGRGMESTVCLGHVFIGVKGRAEDIIKSIERVFQTAPPGSPASAPARPTSDPAPAAAPAYGSLRPENPTPGAENRNEPEPSLLLEIQDIAAPFARRCVKVLGIHDMNFHAGQRFRLRAHHAGTVGRKFERLTTMVVIEVEVSELVR